MAIGLLFTLLLATAALYASAQQSPRFGNLDAIPDGDDYGCSQFFHSYPTPCPKFKGMVWYCLRGRANDGCSVGKPFRQKDCSMQCQEDGTYWRNENALPQPVESASSNWETPKKEDWAPVPVPAPKPAPVCDYQPPCPKGKGKVWYCLSGKAYNGCSVGKPFPSVDCYEQCTDDGYKKVEWSDKKEVEWASSNWETPKKEDWAPVPVPAPKPAPVCDYQPPCPKGKGKIWYCLSGKAYNGCSVGKPFPSVDCYEQCTADGYKKVEWSDKKEVEWASSYWETPKVDDWLPTPKPASVCDYKPPCPKGKGKVWYCLSGKAYNGCSVGKPFPSVDCYEQCTDDGSKAYEWY